MRHISLRLILLLAMSVLTFSGSFWRSSPDTQEPRHRLLRPREDSPTGELQFDGLSAVTEGKEGGKLRKSKNAKRQKGRNGNVNIIGQRSSKGKLFMKTVDKIVVESDRYNLWWTGPLPETVSPSATENPHFFMPELWGRQHNRTANVIFTEFLSLGPPPSSAGDSIPSYFKIFLASLRKVYSEDIVLAIDASLVTPPMKSLLQSSGVVVYTLTEEFCSKDSNNRDIYSCGSYEERIPINVFRYYFYEKWLLNYANTSLVLVSHLHPQENSVFFQSNPFHPSLLAQWRPKYSLGFLQEFFPNMLVRFSRTLPGLLQECYGDEIARTLLGSLQVSSRAFLGTRDGVLVWANAMTRVSPPLPSSSSSPSPLLVATAGRPRPHGRDPLRLQRDRGGVLPVPGGLGEDPLLPAHQALPPGRGTRQLPARPLLLAFGLERFRAQEHQRPAAHLLAPAGRPGPRAELGRPALGRGARHRPLP